MTFTNNSTDATSYSWTFSGGSPSNSTQASPTITYNNPGTYSVSLTATGAGGTDSETKTSYITVDAANCNPWEFITTSGNHTVIVPAAITTDINGSSLEIGDWIGVFFNDNGILQCAGASIWQGVNTTISAFGDEGSTPNVKEGFANNEVFAWKVWRNSSQQEVLVSADYNPVGGIITHTDQFTINGISSLTSLSASQKQTINLAQGWNMISTYIEPSQAGMADVFQGINPQIDLAKDERGATYIPSLSINHIGNWNVQKGYLVKANTATALEIEGERRNGTTTPINLPVGWSIMSYLRDNPMSAATALSGISGEIDLVKDVAGQAYIPSLGINNLGSMQPGQGYQIKMNTATTHNYPLRSITVPMVGSTQSPEHYLTQQRTGHNTTWAFEAKGLTGLEQGDELGVFTESGLLVGSSVFEGVNFALTVWGDDPTTRSIEGAVAGEALEIRIWRKGRILRPLHLESEGPVSYAQDELTIFRQMEVLADYKVDLMPNPAKNKTFLLIQAPESAVISINCYDDRGRQVSTRQLSVEAGKASIPLQVSDWASGIYFYKVQVGDTFHHGKFLVNR